MNTGFHFAPANFLEQIAGVGASFGASITPGTSNATGAWTEMSASLPRNFAGFWLTAKINQDGTVGTTGGNSGLLIDFALGAASSEQLIVEGYRIGTYNRGSQIVDAYVPVALPKGQRLACRAQTAGASSALLGVSLLGVPSKMDGNGMSFSHGKGIGASTSTSLGSPLTGSGTSETAWTEITSSTPFHAKALDMLVGDNNDATNFNAHQLIDLAIGAAGSEVPIIEDWQQSSSGGESVPPANTGFPIDIPKGTRLSWRHQSTAATIDHDIVVMLYR